MERIIHNRHLIRIGLFILMVAGATNSFGQVSTLQNWTNLYHGTSTNQQNITYTVQTGSNTNRVLVVAIASARTTDSGTGTRTVALTYGGQALTLAAGDMGQNLYQHTALYYLNEAGLDAAAANTTLAVTVSGGTTRITDVFAAVFDNVDQLSPITNSSNYYSTNTQTTFAYSPGLTINAQDQAIEIVSSHRTGSYNLRTVSSYPTNWSLTTERTNRLADATRNMIISRSVPASDVTDVASITMSNTSYPSMTALSLKPQSYTLTVGNDGNGSVTLNPAGGTYPSGTTVTLTPVPNTGYEFANWSGANGGDVVNTGGVYTIVMNGNKSVTANFTALPTGSVTSTVAPSDATPRIGDQITATVFIDMSGVNAPDNYLGNYTGTLNWNTSVLSYASFSGAPPAGFAGTVNEGSTGSGLITFNGANPLGATGNIAIITITFNVVGAGTSALDLAFSPMSSLSLKNLLPILTVNDGSVEVASAPTCSVTQDGNVSTGTGLPGATSVSFSHTTGTGTDRLLLVGISWNCGTGDKTVSSITFTPNGGSALNLDEVYTQQYTWTTNNYRYAAIYSLLNPAPGISGTIVINFTAAVTNGIVAGAVNFANVNQNTPFGTEGGLTGTGTDAAGNPTVTLNNLIGDELVFDCVFIGASNANHALTADVGQSPLWNINAFSLASNYNVLSAASTKPAGGTSVTMSWTRSNYGTTATRWAVAAVAINPTTTNTWLGTTSTDWHTASNWCKGVPTSATDVIITAYPTNQPVIPAAALCNHLTINAGASLTIEAGQALTVRGNLTNNGSLTIESTGISSSGSLIVDGTSSGTVTYNRSLNPSGYHYFSSPLVVSELPASTYQYNEGTDAWSNTTSYTQGKGYAISGVSNIGFIGTLLGTDVTINASSPYLYPLAVGETYPERARVPDRNYGGGGWNLIGNPYSSAIRVDGFIDANYNVIPSSSKFDPSYVALYLYNGSSYVFVTKNETGWNTPDNGDGIEVLNQTHVQAGQGFFVLAMNDGVDFVFNRTMQDHSTDATMLKSAGSGDRWPGLMLKVDDGNKKKHTLIVFNDGMSKGLDPIHDVGQMSPDRVIDIYTALVEDNGVNFVRQALPENGAVKNIIPVGITYSQGGNVTFSAEVEPLRNYKFWLEDRTTGAFTDLGMDTYTVNLPARTSGKGRFFIHVTAGRADRPVRENQGLQNLKIWAGQNSEVYILGTVGEKATCEIYNIHGNKMYETLLTDREYNVINLPQLKRGVYVVHVSDGAELITGKVVL